MRGAQLYKEITGHTLERKLSKGRNSSLLLKRNECLIARFYYYCHFKNKCYEDVLRLLVSEFFISAPTISQLVVSHSADIQSLKQKCPALYNFKNRWPHLKWL